MTREELVKQICSVEIDFTLSEDKEYNLDDECANKIVDIIENNILFWVDNDCCKHFGGWK